MKSNQVNLSAKIFSLKALISIVCFVAIQLVFPRAKLFFTITPIALAFYFKQLFYFFLHTAIWVLSKTIYKINVSGLEHVPANSGGIIVSNHVSMLDALIILSTTKRNVRFVMHDKVFNIPVLGFFFKKLNMIPISSKKTKEGLTEFNLRCKTEVENGHLVCIFPEGELTRNGQLAAFKKGIEHLAACIDAPIIPMHMDNVIGTPLSFKPGTHHKYGFNFKTLQKRVFVTIGSPMYKIESAFQLRQTIKKLEFENISKRTQFKTISSAIHNVKQTLFKDNENVSKTSGTELSDLIISTPNYKVKDLMGSKIELIGSKKGSLGRPIPGVLIKVTSTNNYKLSANNTGNIYIKHCFTDNPKWENTGKQGFVDEAGFVTISN